MVPEGDSLAPYKPWFVASFYIVGYMWGYTLFSSGRASVQLLAVRAIEINTFFRLQFMRIGEDWAKLVH